MSAATLVSPDASPSGGHWSIEPPAQAPSTPRRAPTRGHLDQVDLFRVITFAAVVAVHSTAYTNPSISTGEGAAGQLLHFTREAFFFLTGFVLVFSQGRKPLQPLRFWGRRFKLIGIPYLVWTAIYIGYVELQSGGPLADLPKTFLMDAVSGRGYYHLYFLLVSMQAYLLFPVLIWVLRVTRHHPWLLLAGAAALQLAETGYLHHAHPAASGIAHWYTDWSYALFPSYVLYVVAGALAARHLAQAQAWLLDHAAVVLLAGLTSAAVAEAWFFYAVHHGANAGDGPLDASTVLQPVIVLWSCGAILLLALGTCRWASRRRTDTRFYAALQWASSASFGVYLVHPLVLNELLSRGFAGPSPKLLPLPCASIAAWVLTMVGSALLVAVFRRTPLSLPLTGR